MKKIFWLSNFCFSDKASCGSGSWIESMGKGLAACGAYDIYNITLGAVSTITRSDACGIKQWIVPIKYVVSKPMYELPPRAIICGIKKIVDAIRPDLIHVWGTERFWGLLTARKILDYPALLEMQGLTSAMAPYMTGCLSQQELRACFGIREFLRPWMSAERQQKRFAESKIVEEEIIGAHNFIDYQSDWVRAYIDPLTPNAHKFKTRMILREEYRKCSPWKYVSGRYVVFSSCGWAPNKGLHVLIRACNMLKGRYPRIQLRVAGGYGRGIRQSGYEKWIRAHLVGNLDFVPLDALTPLQMINEMLSSSVFVNPSLVESYSMSLAEAMAVGCPCVASYAGAMPEVGGKELLYSPIADAGVLASQIDHLFGLGADLADVSARIRARGLSMHDAISAIDNQCSIYDKVLRDV